VTRELLERLAAFLAGRDWRREGVLARPWPVDEGTADAAEDLINVFSTGVRRAVEGVFVDIDFLGVEDMAASSVAWY